jgi:two-component system sensor histidine kinase KdpD
VRERILVCVGDAGRGLELVRAARRMVNAIRAQWIVLHVERPGDVREGTHARDHVVDVLGFAEDLGAETAIVSGHRIADEILAFARDRHVSRIIVGKPARPAWLERLVGSVVADLLRRSADVDVMVIRGESGDEEPPTRAGPRPRSGWREYASALGVVVGCTVIGAVMRGFFELTNVVMVFLLGVLVAAIRFGRGPAILASVLSVAAFDYFFVPPHLTFAISDTQYAVTFLVMLAVAMTISTLAVRLREQTEVARQRERRTAALYRLSSELAVAVDRRSLLDAAVRWIAEVFDAPAAVLLADRQGRLRLEAGSGPVPAEDEHERGVAQWVYDHLQPAGLGTPTLPGSRAVYLPLRGASLDAGVLGVGPPRGDRLDRPDTFTLLETFANQTALALERVRLAEEAEGARVQVESERLRNTLLASVSHDLRTPLAVITGAASSLLGQGAGLPEAERRALLETVAEEGERLNRLVGDLLDMTRLEAGALTPDRQWQSVEEIVGATLGRLEKPLAGRPVRVEVAPDLFAPLDDVLVGQALFNLVENALKHSPPGTPVEIAARRDGGELAIEVADHGPGLPPGGEERVFEKFWRTRSPGGPPGVGLGLAIARGIAELHGGTLRAENRSGGGARFEMRLPIEGEPPAVEAADPAGAEGARA